MRAGGRRTHRQMVMLVQTQTRDLTFTATEVRKWFA